MATLDERKQALYRRRREAHKQHSDVVRSATEELDLELVEINAQLKKLKDLALDPLVLVRISPGPAVEVYHSSQNPCGKVNPTMVDRGRFNEMPLGEALSLGLRPCTACAAGLRTVG